MFKIYREPELGEHFIVSADPAAGWDKCAMGAKSKTHADTAIVYNEKIDATQLGYEIYKLCMYLHKKTGIWPTAMPERQGGGLATIQILLSLNYPDIFRMPQMGKVDTSQTENYGWVTNQLSRPKGLSDLKLSLYQGVNKIYDLETLQQMSDFQIINGKPQARGGKHDDLVIMEMIGWQGWLMVPNKAIELQRPPDWFKNNTQNWNHSPKRWKK